MENTLPNIKSPSNPIGSRIFRPKILIPVLFLAVIGLAVVLWYSFSNRAQLQTNGVPISAEIEERFGMRISQVTLTAGGGMIDVRYRVLDPNKARELGHYTETMPMIIDESTGATIATTAMGFHTHNVEQGRIYYALYRNTGNAIKHGDKIAVQIGELVLEHVPVQ